MAAYLKMDNLLMNSDSQVVFNSILGKIHAPSQIANHITDISILARKFSNIQFICCNRDTNRLTD